MVLWAFVTLCRVVRGRKSYMEQNMNPEDGVAVQQWLEGQGGPGARGVAPKKPYANGIGSPSRKLPKAPMSSARYNAPGE